MKEQVPMTLALQSVTFDCEDEMRKTAQFTGDAAHERTMILQDTGDMLEVICNQLDGEVVTDRQRPVIEELVKRLQEALKIKE